MKKIKWTVLLIIIIGCITGCGSNKSTGFDSISYQEYEELIGSKESFVLEMMSSDCSHCQSIKPKLQKLMKEYDITIKTINLHDLSSSDKEKFTTTVGTQATPTIIFYKDGYEKSVATRIEGDVSYEKIIQKFKDNGIIQ